MKCRFLFRFSWLFHAWILLGAEEGANDAEMDWPAAHRAPRQADDGDDDPDPVGLFPFDQLPPELQTHIFLALDLRSLAAAMRVSPSWCAMIEEPVMWKLKYGLSSPSFVPPAC